MFLSTSLIQGQTLLNANMLIPGSQSVLNLFLKQSLLLIALPDPPSLSTIRSLLYEMLTPSEGHPSGRMPDELWIDRSVFFFALCQEGLLEQINLSLGQIPFSSKGIPERLFGRLLADLQRDFPAAHFEKNVSDENSLPTFSDIERWCKQWVSLPRFGRAQEDENAAHSSRTSRT